MISTKSKLQVKLYLKTMDHVHEAYSRYNDVIRLEPKADVDPPNIWLTKKKGFVEVWLATKNIFNSPEEKQTKYYQYMDFMVNTYGRADENIINQILASKQIQENIANQDKSNRVDELKESNKSKKQKKKKKSTLVHNNLSKDSDAGLPNDSKTDLLNDSDIVLSNNSETSLSNNSETGLSNNSETGLLNDSDIVLSNNSESGLSDNSDIVLSNNLETGLLNDSDIVLSNNLETIETENIINIDPLDAHRRYKNNNLDDAPTDCIHKSYPFMNPYASHQYIDDNYPYYDDGYYQDYAIPQDHYNNDSSYNTYHQPYDDMAYQSYDGYPQYYYDASGCLISYQTI
jgi:hypothetical protein